MRECQRFQRSFGGRLFSVLDAPQMPLRHSRDIGLLEALLLTQGADGCSVALVEHL